MLAVSGADFPIDVIAVIDRVGLGLNERPAHGTNIPRWRELGKFGCLDKEPACGSMPARSACQKCFALTAVFRDGVVRVLRGALDDESFSVELPHAGFEIEGCAIDRIQPALGLSTILSGRR